MVGKKVDRQKEHFTFFYSFRPFSSGPERKKGKLQVTLADFMLQTITCYGLQQLREKGKESKALNHNCVSKQEFNQN